MVRKNESIVVDSMTNRRRLLAGMGTVAVGSLAGCTGGNGSDNITVNYLAWDNIDFDNPRINDVPYALFVRNIERELEQIDTEVNFEITRAGEIGGPTEIFRAIQNQTVDIGRDVASYNQDVIPLSNAHVLPGLFDSSHVSSLAAWETHQPGGPVDELELNELGFRNLAVLTLPPYQVLSTGDWGRVESVEDFDGLTIRASGVLAQAFEALGASAVDMDATEVYMALERGTVDAAVMNATTGIDSYSLHEVTDHITLNLSPGSVPTNIMANEDSFQSWPGDVQDAITRAGEQLNQQWGQVVDVNERWYLVEAEDRGLDTYEIEDAELEQINDRLRDIQNEWAEDTENGREVLDEHISHLESYRSEYEDRLEDGRITHLLKDEFGDIYEEYGLAEEYPEFMDEYVR